MHKGEKVTFVIDECYVDGYGHVNYKAFLSFFEAGRNDFNLKRGTVNIGQFGLQGFTKAVNIVYHGQLRGGDHITIATRVSHIGNTSLTFKQAILKNRELIAEADTVYVMVDEAGVKTRIPDELRNIFMS